MTADRVGGFHHEWAGFMCDRCHRLGSSLKTVSFAVDRVDDLKLSREVVIEG